MRSQAVTPAPGPRTTLAAQLATALAASLLLAVVPDARAEPFAVVRSEAVGRQVRERAGPSTCHELTRGACPRARASSEPGGFRYLSGVAVDRDGHSPFYGFLYVADLANQRVQSLTPTHAFFGLLGRTPLDTPTSVAVDARTGNVYVEEARAGQIAVFTAGGLFLRTLGAHAALTFSALSGDVVAVGGPRDLVYCADERRVVELTRTGRRVRDVSPEPVSPRPAGALVAIAVDGSGDMFVLDHLAVSGTALAPSDSIRELAPGGRLLRTFGIRPWQRGASVELQGLALDAHGDLFAIGLEQGPAGILRRIGAIFSARSGRFIGEFALSADNDGSIAFAPDETLYLAATDEQELLVFRRMPVPELVSSPVPCEVADETVASEHYDCAFAGGVDPYTPGV